MEKVRPVTQALAAVFQSSIGGQSFLEASLYKSQFIISEIYTFRKAGSCMQVPHSEPLNTQRTATTITTVLFLLTKRNFTAPGATSFLVI